MAERITHEEARAQLRQLIDRASPAAVGHIALALKYIDQQESLDSAHDSAPPPPGDPKRHDAIIRKLYAWRAEFLDADEATTIGLSPSQEDALDTLNAAIDALELAERIEKRSAPPPPGDEAVERVAAAIFESRHISLKYWQLQDEKKDDFRRYARAAIEAFR